MNNIKKHIIYLFLFVGSCTFSNKALGNSDILDSLSSVFYDGELKASEQIKLFNRHLTHFEKKSDELAINLMKLYIAGNFHAKNANQISQGYLDQIEVKLYLLPESFPTYLFYYIKGSILQSSGKSKDGLTYLKKGISLIENTKEEIENSDKKYLIQLYNKIAVSFDQNQQVDSAQYYYKKGIKIVNGNGEGCEGLELIVNSNTMNPEPEDAIKNYLSVLEQCNASNSEHVKPVLYNNLSIAYILTQKWDKALNSLDSGYYYSKKLNNHQALITNLHLKSEYYASQGDFKAAFKQNYTIQSKEDILKNEMYSQQIKDLEDFFNLEQERRKVIEKQNHIELLKEEERINNLLQKSIIGGSAALMIILVLIGLRMRSKNTKRKEINAINRQLVQEQFKNKELESVKLHEEIDLKNKNLSDITSYLSSKYQYTDEILEKLKQLKRSSEKNEDVLDLITFTSKHLKSEKDFDAVWEEINEVNGRFLENLKTRFPDLTKGEIQLCTLIHLNLRDKEMAMIKDVNHQTIRQAKTRIRKKLKMPEGARMREFLSGI